MAQKNRQLAAKAERAARERAAFATEATAKAERIAMIMAKPDTDDLIAAARRAIANGTIHVRRIAPTAIPASARRIVPTDKVKASCLGIRNRFDSRQRAARLATI